ncbi:MAG: hypothetical protein U1F57_09110 [bacterium]
MAYHVETDESTVRHAIFARTPSEQVITDKRNEHSKITFYHPPTPVPTHDQKVFDGKNYVFVSGRNPVDGQVYEGYVRKQDFEKTSWLKPASEIKENYYAKKTPEAPKNTPAPNHDPRPIRGNGVWGRSVGSNVPVTPSTTQEAPMKWNELTQTGHFDFAGRRGKTVELEDVSYCQDQRYMKKADEMASEKGLHTVYFLGQENVHYYLTDDQYQSWKAVGLKDNGTY